LKKYMCLHRQNHLTPRRVQPLLVAQGHGASQLPSARESFTSPARATQNATEPDGGNGNVPPSKLDVLFGALVFAGFALLGFALAGWLAFREWFELKRVCSWCRVRLGGNPFTRNVTHGICGHCLAEKKREIAQVVPIRFVTTATGTTH
jgi:hypothetical protein